MGHKKILNTSTIKKMKQNQEPIAMITAYDYPSAQLAEQAGADIILVGDSLGMAVLGYESTIPVTIEDMLHHTKAVTRAAKNTFVVSDLPFLSYHGSIDQTLQQAGRIMQEGLAKAVKLEGGAEISERVRILVQAGVPVMGHIGLTPQAVHQVGGYKVQGKSLDQALKLMEDALALQEAGIFALVLEMVPEELAAWLSEALNIPTIGIGAGRSCDGQVLVFHDLLQYASPVQPRFVKAYANVGQAIESGIGQYVAEVKNKSFPEEENVFHMDAEAWEKLKLHKQGMERNADR